MPTVTLPSAPNAFMAYSLYPGDSMSSLLIVCLNGLGLPQTVWQPTIEILKKSAFSPDPWILTYDRFGQGSSPRDPRESWPNKDAGYAHTLDDVTDDLHHLIHLVSPDRNSRLIFVNNSIGAHVARRYADRYPGTVEGILFLDSNPGNTDYASIWPNPMDSSFNLELMVPPNTPLEVYEAAYIKMTTIFAATAKNNEGFDRRDIKDILPEPSFPKLKGSKTSNKGPWITVVGHELETFSQEEWAMMKVPLGMAAMYTQPMWQKYNEGLCKLTDSDRAKGPLIAPKTGHFIQKDNPSFVADQLEDLIRKVEGSHQSL
ncbi:Alpha/beta hydrolase fold-1 [Hypoxylon trugodes]|uniref:Alpha/beta hydrolase fold-1 n=1 Tax=Hypoxylon trugodes TaxID=326681 RepID=UPI00218DF0BE|nr:Alpha/beta hydrolase fold-1 [Hypoxylon trugodes]KAI1383851.1 Alpha/beta hydrolase fold-1 [Hypoxylon trugodes]